MATGAPQTQQNEVHAGPSLSTIPFAVNERYVHTKTHKALTVRYVGQLPGASDGLTWIGVEYDDPACGKGHSGVYKGTQVFQTVQLGAGAFIKFAGKNTPLRRGTSLVDALEERYGALVEDAQKPGADTGKHGSSEDSSVVLGSSNAAIVVEAPNMDAVRRRIGRLERLREIGFDGEWVAILGGSADKRQLFKERLKSELFATASLTPRRSRARPFQQPHRDMGTGRGNCRESAGVGYPRHEVSPSEPFSRMQHAPPR